jgi:hypothetical protein
MLIVGLLQGTYHEGNTVHPTSRPRDIALKQSPVINGEAVLTQPS